MKKLASVLLVYLVICIFAYSLSHAQSFDAEKAFNDYVFTQSNYQEAYSAYQEAKAFYKKNPTLQLREEARKKTLDMLKSRDRLMVVYFTAIRMQLSETKGFTYDEKNNIFGKIDPEVLWYQNHINSYLESDDLNSLFVKSDESKNHYQNTSKPVIYETLFDISLSQEIGLKVDHETVYSSLKSYLNGQVSNGKMTLDPFNRWLNDTDAILTTLNKNEDDARKKIAASTTQSYNQSQSYAQAVQILSANIILLNQLNNYVTEMLTTIVNLSQ